MQSVDGSQRVETRSQGLPYYTCVTAIYRGRKHCPSPSLPAAVIESAVVGRGRPGSAKFGQVKSIATDAGLRRGVPRQAWEQVGDELDELQTQQSQLKQQLAKAEEQIQDVITRKEPNVSPTVRSRSRCIQRASNHSPPLGRFRNMIKAKAKLKAKVDVDVDLRAV